MEAILEQHAFLVRYTEAKYTSFGLRAKEQQDALRKFCGHLKEERLCAARDAIVQSMDELRRSAELWLERMDFEIKETVKRGGREHYEYLHKLWRIKLLHLHTGLANAAEFFSEHALPQDQ